MVLLFLLACNESAEDAGSKGDTGADDGDSGGGDSGSGDSDDSGTAGEGTGPGDAVALDVEAVISEAVHTVVIVSWRTEAATTGRVEFGATAAYGMVSNDTPSGTDHRVLLLGMPADTDVHFRVVIDDESADEGSGGLPTRDYAITTLSLPAGIPQYVTSGSVGDRWQYTVLPTQGGTNYVTIIDQDGEIIWYYAPEGEGNLMKAVVTHDRQQMLLGHAGNQGELENSRLEWVSLDGYGVHEESVPYFDHDMTELPDGTVTMIVVEPRTMDDGREWSADTLVERAPDGTLTEIFNAWDSIDPTGLGLDSAVNWTHANGLDYVEADDCYYLSMKEIGSVARIPRATGEIDWMVNGKLNDFEFLNGAAPGVMQHQFEVLGDGRLLLFDNGAPERGYSRAVELQLDFEAMTAEEIWDYVRVPSVYVYAKGDVQRFSDNTTQVTWSTSGEMQIVDESGVVLWQLNADLGQAMTFVQPIQSFYEDR
jgi:hypothetical protein